MKMVVAILAALELKTCRIAAMELQRAVMLTSWTSSYRIIMTTEDSRICMCPLPTEHGTMHDGEI